MEIYKSTMRQLSASGSVWHADTLFGHLCWYYARGHELTEFEAFLNLYLLGPEDGDPPILLSDGFPGDYLPNPVAVEPLTATQTAGKAERIKHRKERKATQEQEWITLDQFNAFRRATSMPISPTGPAPGLPNEGHLPSTHMTTRNWVNRLSNTAGDPYDFEQFHMPLVTVYWKIKEPFVEFVSAFIADLENAGYGKRKAVGYGQVQCEGPLMPFSGFEEVQGANGFVTLSRFVPAPSDPVDGYWNAIVKYGKLGEEFACDHNPFKRPFIQIDRGACFRDPAPREWYGQLLGDLSVRKEVKQYAFAFAVPIRFPT